MPYLLTILILGLAPAFAEGSAEDIKNDFKKIGRDVKELGVKIHKEVKEEAAEVGQQVRKTTHEVKEDVNESGKTWGQRIGSAFQEIGHGFKNAWSRLRGEPPAGSRDDFK